MGEITVIRRDGTTLCLKSQEPFIGVTSAKQITSLMGDDMVQLAIVSSAPLTFNIGDRIVVGGCNYAIRGKNVTEIYSDNCYKYDVTFYGVIYDLLKTLYRNCDSQGHSSRSSFDLTYDLKGFVQVIINNLNRDYPGLWVFDANNCPETEEKTLSFSNQNCLQVLQTLCQDEYKLDFVIEQDSGVNTIRIGTFGQVISPPAGNSFFEVGKGGGLYTLKESKVDDKSIISRLWVEGGSDNIRNDYRDYSDRLQLPYPKRLNYNEHVLKNGDVIEAGSQLIGISDENKRCLEDTRLMSVIGCIESVKTYDDIYPKRTGEVTAIDSEDICKFTDNTMDFDLNATDNDGNTLYLVDGTTAKITFITGLLAGQQFELKKSGGYDHDTKTFTILPFTDERNMTFPSPDSNAFRIAVGDKYKITDINMPQSYIDTAEEDLWYESIQDFADLTVPHVQYELAFGADYFINALPEDTDTAVFVVGDYVPIKNSNFGIESNVRVQKVTRNLLARHDYQLTVSDSTTTMSFLGEIIQDVIQHNIIIANNHLTDISRARLGWKTTEELKNMVYDTDGYFDMENIRPNSVSTNMLAVGAKSQQFILTGVVLEANYGGNANQFRATGGVLHHLAIDPEQMVQWNMSGGTFTLNDNGGFYVFAKCSKSGNTGLFIVTQTQYMAEPASDPNNYYFQVGIIGSYDSSIGFRDFVTTYGFTRINGNTITTGRINSSGGGDTYFDLDAGEIGGKIKFKAGTSGYNNISDKPDLSQYMKDTDGIIDIWYKSVAPTTSNVPASGWNTTELKKEHIGDLYRYSYNAPVDGEEGQTRASYKWYRWEKRSTIVRIDDQNQTVITYQWTEITDVPGWFANIVPSTLPATSQKMFSFITPVPPYNIGDIWLNGGVFMKARVAKGVHELFDVGDWDDAGIYDNTQTVIDGGIITSGRIQLASDDQHIVAGVTGEGTADTAIRFWAGATHAQRAQAPFRVQQNGKVIATNAEIEGKIKTNDAEISNAEITNAEITNSIIKGSMRSPFVVNDYGSTPASFDKNDNIIADAPVSLLWDVSQSGRRLIIAGDGNLSLPPSGKFYYVNGERLVRISFTNEVLQLVGLGTTESFDGWLVQRLGALKYQINGNKLQSFGSPLHVIMMGTVYQSNGSWTMAPSQPINHHYYTQTLSHPNTGYFKVSLPKGLFGLTLSGSDYSLVNEMAVLATAVGTDAIVSVESILYKASSDKVEITFATQRCWGEYYQTWENQNQQHVMTDEGVKAKRFDVPFSFIIIKQSRWKGFSDAVWWPEDISNLESN